VFNLPYMGMAEEVPKTRQLRGVLDTNPRSLRTIQNNRKILRALHQFPQSHSPLKEQRRWRRTPCASLRPKATFAKCRDCLKWESTSMLQYPPPSSETPFSFLIPFLPVRTETAYAPPLPPTSLLLLLLLRLLRVSVLSNWLVVVPLLVAHRRYASALCVCSAFPPTKRVPDFSLWVGTQPLMRACFEGHVAVAKLLLQHGADPTLRVSPYDLGRRQHQ
jgi:hypothetical protein